MSATPSRDHSPTRSGNVWYTAHRQVVETVSRPLSVSDDFLRARSIHRARYLEQAELALHARDLGLAHRLFHLAHLVGQSNAHRRGTALH